jgi:Mrp family chromosome partitioning ATPase
MKSTVSNDLSFIPSGDIPKNPVELLSSKKMIDLIKIQQEKFDVVIVDSSPVRDIPDSIILSTLVDVTVLSVQINKTNIKDLSYALSRFENTKSNLLGIVATDIKSSYSHYRAPKQLFPTLTKKANFKGLLNENITS